MTIEQLIAGLCALVFITGAVITVWAFIRFSIVAPWRTRNALSRLTEPRLQELAAEWNVQIPDILGTFYRKSGIVQLCNFFLVAPEADTPRWYVACFIPLTKVDIAEWLKATRVPGIPLAVNGTKGTYYVAFDSLKRGGLVPVFLREPGLGRKDTLVASSLEEFTRFRAIEASAEDEE